MESGHFSTWLSSTKEQFKALTEREKTETLGELLNLCGSEQLLFLMQSYLPSNCRIDFLSRLPSEICDKIVCYLDDRSVYNCCLVSRSWNSSINQCKKVWADLVWNIGGARQRVLNKPAHVYKNQFIRRRSFLTSSQRGLYVTTPYREDIDGACVWSCYQGNIAAAVKSSASVFLCTTTSPREGRSVYLQCAIRAVAMDRLYLYIASDTIACTYDLDTLDLYKTYQGHVRCLLSVDGCCDSGLLVTGSADCTVKLWNLHTADILFSSQQHHIGWVFDVKMLFDSRSSCNAFIAYDSNANLSVWVVKDIENSGTWNIQYVDDVHTDMKKTPVLSKDKRGFFVFQKSLHNLYENNFCTMSFYTVLLQRSDTYRLQLVRNIDICHRFQDILAVGDRFIIFIQYTLENYYMCVYDLLRQRILMTVPLPENLPCSHNWTVCLEKRDWLDSFTSTNLPDSLFCVLTPQIIHQHRCRLSPTIQVHTTGTP